MKRKKDRPKSKKDKDEMDEFRQQYDYAPIETENYEAEPRYCFCNGVSYGDMVGCDNSSVSLINISVIKNGSITIV